MTTSPSTQSTDLDDVIARFVTSVEALDALRGQADRFQAAADESEKARAALDKALADTGATLETVVQAGRWAETLRTSGGALGDAADELRRTSEQARDAARALRDVPDQLATHVAGMRRLMYAQTGVSAAALLGVLALLVR